MLANEMRRRRIERSASASCERRRVGVRLKLLRMRHGRRRRRRRLKRWLQLLGLLLLMLHRLLLLQLLARLRRRGCRLSDGCYGVFVLRLRHHDGLCVAQVRDFHGTDDWNFLLLERGGATSGRGPRGRRGTIGAVRFRGCGPRIDAASDLAGDEGGVALLLHILQLAGQRQVRNDSREVRALARRERRGRSRGKSGVDREGQRLAARRLE